jgi:hypothetical protein
VRRAVRVLNIMVPSRNLLNPVVFGCELALNVVKLNYPWFYGVRSRNSSLMKMSSDHQRFRASISFTGVIAVDIVSDTRQESPLCFAFIACCEL